MKQNKQFFLGILCFLATVFYQAKTYRSINILLLIISSGCLILNLFTNIILKKYKKICYTENIFTYMYFTILVMSWCTSDFKMKIYFANYILLIFIMMFLEFFLRIITKSYKIPIILFTLLNVIICTANYISYKLRGICLSYTDLKCLQTAVNVKDNYEIHFSISFILLILSYVIFSVGTLKANKRIYTFEKTKEITLTTTIYLLVGFIIALNLSKLGFSSNVWNPNSISYPFYFINTMIDRQSQEPDDYSSDEIEKLSEKYKSDTKESDVSIIAIMDESFAFLDDFNVINFS